MAVANVSQLVQLRPPLGSKIARTALLHSTEVMVTCSSVTDVSCGEWARVERLLGIRSFRLPRNNEVSAHLSNRKLHTVKTDEATRSVSSF